MSIGTGMPGYRRYMYALALLTALVLSWVVVFSGAQGVQASAPSPGSTATPGGGKALTSATPTPAAICDYAWYLVGAPQSNFRMLSSVAAVSAGDVWAVGRTFDDPPRSHPISNHWDGTAWSEVPMPVVGSVLNGVAAVTASDVWAVGETSYDTTRFDETLIEHWDGAAWTVVPSPNVPDVHNNLQAVAVVSASDVWAVGWTVLSVSVGSYHTLVEHWDGTQWSIVSGPALASSAKLNAITVVSANQVWAVGSLGTDLYAFQTLVERWDGAAWTVVSSPNVGGTGRLNGVAAVSASDIWAVGDYNPPGMSRTLTEHWDGSAWSVIDSPTFGDDYVNSVAAVSSNDVWAVGQYGDGPFTLTLHWDGSTWTRTRSPQPAFLSTHEVNSISALSTGDIWAVGYYASVDFNAHSLVMHYTSSFLDVHPTDYFYDAVRYLYCGGAISGYADGTFRPWNNTTRSQVAKIIVSAESWPYSPPPQTPTFSDVPSTNPFYYYVETLNTRGVISGYSDHTYRPANDVTRAQLSKIVVLAQQWPINSTGGPHFRDVGTDDPFYGYIETAFNRQIISGYDCGPSCLEFRPGWSATRGQIAKIVFNALLQTGRLTGRK